MPAARRSTSTRRAARRSSPTISWSVRYGAEVGARTTYLPGLQSALAFWWLHIGSELVFEGDAGSTAPSAPSQRYGVELANYYDPNEWVTLDADFSFSHASFTHTVDDDENGLSGTDIPEAVKSVIATGIAVHQPGDHGFFGELRLRYFGPRDSASTAASSRERRRSSAPSSATPSTSTSRSPSTLQSARSQGPRDRLLLSLVRARRRSGARRGRARA